MGSTVIVKRPFLLMLAGRLLAALVFCLLFSRPVNSATLAELREAGHARQFLDEGRPEQVVAQCRQFVERFPASTLGDQVQDLEGRAWVAMKRPAEALGAFQGLAARHPDSPLAPRAFLQAGECLLKLDRSRDAVKTWLKLAERHPTSEETPWALLKAEEHSPIEDRSVRRELLRRVLDTFSESDPGQEAARRLAEILLQDGRADEARHLLERAAVNSTPGPMQNAAVLALARLHQRRQQPDAALEVLSQALIEAEDTQWRGSLWLEQAMLRMKLGRAAEAGDALRQALDQARPDWETLTLTDSLRLLLGDALAWQDQLEDAVAVWESAVIQRPELLARQAWALARQGSWAASGDAWRAVADSLAGRTELDARGQRLLAASLLGMVEAERESGINSLEWPSIARLARQLPAAMPEAADLAASMIDLGQLDAAKHLLSALDDPPRQQDRRGLLRLRLALARRNRDDARELARIIRERWPASPLLAEVDQLSPNPQSARSSNEELENLRREWDEDTTPSIGKRRQRIDELMSLRREHVADRGALSGELALQWNGLRECIVPEGRNAATHADCARMTLAWADSLADPPAVVQLARVASHEALGERKPARTILERILLEQSGDPHVIEAARQLALNPDTDAETRAEIQERLWVDWPWHPESPTILRAIATAELQAGRAEQALELVRRLRISDEQERPLPDMIPAADATLLELEGLCLEALGRSDEARVTWLQALAAIRDADSELRPQLRFRIGNSFQQEGRLKEAESTYLNLISDHPESPATAEALRVLSQIKLGQGLPQDALELAERLQPAKSNDPGLRTHWVRLLYLTGDFDKGKKEFLRLLKDAAGKVNEDTLKASINMAKGLGALALQQDDVAKDAFSYVLEKLDRTPQAPAAQVELARLMGRSGQIDAALKSLAAMVKRWPQAPELSAALLLRGRLLAESADPKTARVDLEQAAAKARNSWERAAALGELAGLLKRLDRLEDQQKVLERYLEECPDAPDLEGRRIERAMVIAARGDAVAGRSALRALQADADEDATAEIQFRLGELAEAEGDVAGAVLEFLKVPHLGRSASLDWDASALFRAAQGLEELARPRAAEDVLRQVIEIHGASSGHGLRAASELERLRKATQLRQQSDDSKERDS